MKKIIIFGLIWIFLSATVCFAQSVELQLTAGNTSVDAGLDVKRELDQGYYKTGIGFVYNDDEDDEDELYRIGDVRIVVGSEAFYQGLQCELGLKGIYGLLENKDDDGEILGLGFMGRAAYTLSENICPIPIEFAFDISWTPGPLSFLDMDNYLETQGSVSIFIVQNAAIIFSYKHFNIHMDNEPGEWKMDDDLFSVGLRLRF